MFKKRVPLGLKLVLTVAVLSAIFALIKGFSTPPGGVVLGGTMIFVALILFLGVSQREQIIVPSIKIYFIMVIIMILYDVLKNKTPFKFVTGIEIIVFLIIIRYMHSKEIKELFQKKTKTLYDMEEIL